MHGWLPVRLKRPLPSSTYNLIHGPNGALEPFSNLHQGLCPSALSSSTTFSIPLNVLCSTRRIHGAHQCGLVAEEWAGRVRLCICICCSSLSLSFPPFPSLPISACPTRTSRERLEGTVPALTLPFSAVPFYQCLGHHACAQTHAP